MIYKTKEEGQTMIYKTKEEGQTMIYKAKEEGQTMIYKILHYIFCYSVVFCGSLLNLLL
jgi:hypothetical protein